MSFNKEKQFVTFVLHLKLNVQRQEMRGARGEALPNWGLKGFSPMGTNLYL